MAAVCGPLQWPAALLSATQQQHSGAGAPLGEGGGEGMRGQWGAGQQCGGGAGQMMFLEPLFVWKTTSVSARITSLRDRCIEMLRLLSLCSSICQPVLHTWSWCIGCLLVVRILYRWFGSPMKRDIT